MNIVIFSNCAGNILTHMFNLHPYTSNKYTIHYISNYEHFDEVMSESNKNLFQTCDIFMYQPLNNSYSHSMYNISHIKQLLKESCVILRVNYYRFKGFWFESEYKPFSSFKAYKFVDSKYYGIHDSFTNFIGNKLEVCNKIQSLKIDTDAFMNHFSEELENFKILDDNSDIKLYDFLIKNYKSKHLFHDVFHPTNLFFYEMFRQIVHKLTGHELNEEDLDFLNKLIDIEMTHWALPILPQIKSLLHINTPDTICVFYPGYADKRIFMDIYDYYYIRLSHTNFQSYLDTHEEHK